MRHWMKAGLAALALSALVPLHGSDKALDRNVDKAFRSIDFSEGYAITRTLSAPEFAGRLTGHEGFAAAAKWAAGKFREWGLKPIDPKAGYLQAYPSPYTVIDTAAMTLFLAGKPVEGQEAVFQEKKLEPETDFLPLLYSDSGDRTAGLVFAGWGISAPELNYDDYSGIDVRDKFVLCFRGTPEDPGKDFQPYDEHRTRMKTARDKGALGLIYIYSEAISSPNGNWLQGFTPAMVTEKIGDLILKETGSSAAELKTALLTWKRPISFPLRSKARLVVASRTFPKGIGYNIAGYVEGSDPKLRRECLVVGGHFDHNGVHMGLLFPGADDNASGSAAVMLIAKAFVGMGKKPRRSVVFALFGGEEMGLQGSTWFVEHPPGPFSRVDGMFNFDMVGEGAGIGYAVTPGQPDILKVLEEAGIRVKAPRSQGTIRGYGVRSSDFAPFFQKGIPCATFYSTGPHIAYHQTGDSIYRINPDIIADTARLAFLGAVFWADR
jgi:hypothetical protein